MGAATPTFASTDRWSCDVLIIGAGPAGTAAAMEATKRGMNAVVVDKARFPRDKCCGDGLTTAALRHLDELGLDPHSIPSWVAVSTVTLRGPSGRTSRLQLPAGRGTFAAVCRRRELDSALVDLARQLGATVLEGHELRSIRAGTDEVTAEVDGIAFSAKYVVAADGMWSPTRKLLGVAPPQYRGEWHAFRQYFSNVSEKAKRELVVWFEPDLLPGYAWSFPLGDGSANIGFGIQRGRSHSVQDMKRLWPQLLQLPHVTELLGADAVPESPHRAWPIPARLGRVPLTNGRVFFVGDAAAATDPLTGEGIGQALETGRAAVTAIVENGFDNPVGAAEQYRRGLRRGMMRDHLVARSLSTILAHGRLTRAVIATVDSSDWTRRNFARWLFEDYPRAAVFTPHRWHQRLFSDAGAFHSNRTDLTSGGADAERHLAEHDR